MKHGLACVCWSGFLSMLLPLVSAAELPKLDPQQPYSAEKRHPTVHTIDFQITVTPPAKTKVFKVWVPIPPSDSAQEVLASSLSTFPTAVVPQVGVEPTFQNRFAYFEFDRPVGAQIIRHELKIKTWELRWRLEADRIQTIKQWPESFAKYQRSESQAVVADQRFDRLLVQIVPQRKNPLSDMSSVMNWVDGNFQYDHGKASLKGSSLHGLETRAGHCSDYHGFCAAMGRLMGQPTRLTYGLNTFPKASPSHCKLEVFLAPAGWVSFDVSETQKLLASLGADESLSSTDRTALKLAAQDLLATGFRDNTWFLQTRGTDYDLVPKATSRVPVVRTIYAEADGKPLRDPDPSDPQQTTFAWMTAMKASSEPHVSYPLANSESFRKWVAADQTKTENKP